MMFCVRAAFWLTVVSFFMAPQDRIIDLSHLHLPERLEPYQSASAHAMPDEAYCAREAELCATALAMLDTVVTVGAANLNALADEIAQPSARAAR